MSATAKMQLVTFNTLALRFQDDAYTLAYYLSGSDVQATQATETAFVRLYRWAGLCHEQFRLETFRKVLANCRKINGAIQPGQPGGDLRAQLLRLNFEERAAVVLVDVLDLSYDDAAWVMNISPKQAGRLLAQGRIALSQAASGAPMPVLS